MNQTQRAQMGARTLQKTGNMLALGVGGLKEEAGSRLQGGFKTPEDH